MEDESALAPILCPHCGRPMTSPGTVYPGWAYCYHCRCWRHTDGTPNQPDEQPGRPQNGSEMNPRTP